MNISGIASFVKMDYCHIVCEAKFDKDLLLVKKLGFSSIFICFLT